MIKFNHFNCLIDIIVIFWSFSWHFNRKWSKLDQNASILIRNWSILFENGHRHLIGNRFQHRILNQMNFVIWNWNPNVAIWFGRPNCLSLGRTEQATQWFHNWSEMYYTTHRLRYIGYTNFVPIFPKKVPFINGAEKKLFFKQVSLVTGKM